MPRLYLVRHGRATGGWDDDVDPGIDTLVGHRRSRPPTPSNRSVLSLR